MIEQDRDSACRLSVGTAGEIVGMAWRGEKVVVVWETPLDCVTSSGVEVVGNEKHEATVIDIIRHMRSQFKLKGKQPEFMAPETLLVEFLVVNWAWVELRP